MRGGKKAQITSPPNLAFVSGFDGWVAKYPTWDFEWHTEVNLYDWDVLHAWSFLVYLQEENLWCFNVFHKVVQVKIKK